MGSFLHMYTVICKSSCQYNIFLNVNVNEMCKILSHFYNFRKPKNGLFKEDQLFWHVLGPSSDKVTKTHPPHHSTFFSKCFGKLWNKEVRRNCCIQYLVKLELSIEFCWYLPVLSYEYTMVLQPSPAVKSVIVPKMLTVSNPLSLLTICKLV